MAMAPTNPFARSTMKGQRKSRSALFKATHVKPKDGGGFSFFPKRSKRTKFKTL